MSLSARLPVGLLEAHLLPRLGCSSYPPWARRTLTLRPTHSRFASTSTSTSPRVHLRFAPSPTGHLHLGGLRTVLFNHLLARNLGGTWTLRIEDTDQTRYVEGAVESLLETLAWAKLDFDDGPGKDGGRGPYFQSQRKVIYDKYIQKLIDSGRAYHCFCTPARLSETRDRLKKSGSNSTYDRKCLGLGHDETERRIAADESSVVRFKSSPDGLVQNDLVYDPIKYESLPIEDFVLRKSDGLPTYHLANVVDDHEMGVTHVLRGEEWLPSTPKHLALYAALGLEPPKFAHMPLLINPDGSKLSKRTGDVRVSDYIARGYEPEALLNFVALMGWSPAHSKSASDHDSSEVMSVQELINAFSIEGINRSRAKMSPSKLDFLNRAHVQAKVRYGNGGGRWELATKLRELLAASDPKCENISIDYLSRVIATLKDRLHTINDVPVLGAYFFAEPDLESPDAEKLFKTVKPEVYQRSIKAAIETVQNLSGDAFLEPNTDDIIAALNALSVPDADRTGTKLMNSLRHALTGQKVGAGVAATIGTLGRDATLKRLRTALARMEVV